MYISTVIKEETELLTSAMREISWKRDEEKDIRGQQRWTIARLSHSIGYNDFQNPAKIWPSATSLDQSPSWNNLGTRLKPFPGLSLCAAISVKMATENTSKKRKWGPYLSYLTNPLLEEVPRSTLKCWSREESSQEMQWEGNVVKTDEDSLSTVECTRACSGQVLK